MGFENSSIVPVEEPRADIPDTPAFDIVVRDEPFGVDLRELYCELGSKQDFSTWAKSRLSQFVKDEDFASFHRIVERETGASKRTDYAVSLDCAKHIAMMEQTERGRRVRRYFIDCEKALRKREVKEPTDPRLVEMRDKLRNEEGKAIHGKRNHTVEPVFGGNSAEGLKKQIVTIE